MTTTLHIRRTWDGRPIPEAEAVRVDLSLTSGHLVIEVDAPFHGDPAPPGAPGPTPELWEHEVVELFVTGTEHESGAPSYTEVELSPHGHHLVLQLRAVRQVLRDGLPLDFQVTREGKRWRGWARLPRELLPLPPHRVNAYAIHGRGDARRYLAAEPVPGDEPDFHRLECFVPVTFSVSHP